MIVLDSIKVDLINHAKEEAPKECCGIIQLLDGDLKYFKCNNISNKPNSFEISSKDLMVAEDRGEILAYFHSHVNRSAAPTDVDLVSCEKSNKTWIIYSILKDEFLEFSPSNYIPPLLGREFVHGVMDCWTLCKDYYQLNLNTFLPDFEREDWWWLRGGNLYLDPENHKKANLVFISGTNNILPNDIILMQIRSKVANHAAIYLGDDIILHHCSNRLSSREVYGGFWKKCTIGVLRYIK